MKKYSTRDVVSAIASTTTYQFNRHGHIEHDVSRDFATHGLLENIIREQQYIESLDASNGVAFQLDRDRSRTWISKEHAAGHRFYHLIAAPKPNPPLAYRFGEVSDLLHEVAVELNIHRAMFSGNPMAVVGIDGYREAELANAFGQRVYERKKNTVFKDRLNAQKRRIKQANAKAMRLIERSMDGRSQLRCERVELTFEREWPELPLKEANKRFQRFLEALYDGGLPSAVAGLWFREHLSETGWRFHFVFLIDGMHPSSARDQVVQELQKLWSQSAKSRGHTFPLLAMQDQPRTWGSTGLLIYVKSQLLDSIALMLHRELHFRLDTPPEMEHFGTIKLASSMNTETSIQGLNGCVAGVQHQASHIPTTHLTALPLL
ncbi:hypothetical protein [Ferribacterium limneticum]|uniref:hypothetical protein n=1 Tax=Ferribacterium limneticum TaxID=76259 RepID=UPI001CFC1949|nr:hypothetical protein [Ferribacterium limneticum]UCV19525.1 hypothetical protein KI610_02775 [Ferribacterium limneticum]